MIRIELPDEGELVVAVIKKIMPYGAFCVLPEYGDLEAFLHISEVAPRWIKNIHEFISEGQQHVVMVHRVDSQKNQVDVSIKRVSEAEKKRKLELVRNEKRGIKLLELAIKSSKSKIELVKAREEIESHFGDTYSCFKEVSVDPKLLDDLELPKSLKDEILVFANKNIKKSAVEIDTVVKFLSYNSNGISDLKKAFDLGDEVSVHYLGAPNYKISLIAPDYKSGEKRLQKILESIKDFAQKNNCNFDYESR